jgi:hypothetical protein
VYDSRRKKFTKVPAKTIARSEQVIDLRAIERPPLYAVIDPGYSYPVEWMGLVTANDGADGCIDGKRERDDQQSGCG